MTPMALTKKIKICSGTAMNKRKKRTSDFSTCVKFGVPILSGCGTKAASKSDPDPDWQQNDDNPCSLRGLGNSHLSLQ